MINLTKWVLPLAATGLLALIALWPEINAAATKARLAMGHVSGEVSGGKVIEIQRGFASPIVSTELNRMSAYAEAATFTDSKAHYDMTQKLQ